MHIKAVLGVAVGWSKQAAWCTAACGLSGFESVGHDGQGGLRNKLYICMPTWRQAWWRGGKLLRAKPLRGRPRGQRGRRGAQGARVADLQPCPGWRHLLSHVLGMWSQGAWSLVQVHPDLRQTLVHLAGIPQLALVHLR